MGMQVEPKVGKCESGHGHGGHDGHDGKDGQWAKLRPWSRSWWPTNPLSLLFCQNILALLL